MLPHNLGCWLANIIKFITGNIILTLGLVLLSTEKDPYLRRSTTTQTATELKHRF